MNRAGLRELCCVLLAAGVLTAPRGLAQDRVSRDLLAIEPSHHIEFFSSRQSRFTGYPGCYEAEQYIHAEFEKLGLANVKRTPFKIIIPEDHGGRIRIGSQDIPILCVYPNLVRTPKTAEAGIDGRLIWANEGYLKDFNDKDVMGSIVLMRFNTATRWLNAANLGAKAVIFIEPESAFRPDAEQKYVKLPVPTPRYYLQKHRLPALAAAVTKGEESGYTVEAALGVIEKLGTEIECLVNVRASMVWEEKTVYRVSGEIPGTDPDLTQEVMVVHAYYDSTSVVPALSPGAEGSCGIASLLEIAEFLLKYPPRRTVKFLAAPGHYQGLAGVRQYAFEEIYPKRLASGAETLSGEPQFFIGLDLSSRQNTMAGFYKGHFFDHFGAEEIQLQRIYAELSTLLLDWAGLLPVPADEVNHLEFQSGIVPQHGRDWRSLVPDKVAFDAEVIDLSGRPGITLATTGDHRNLVSTPLDTFAQIKPFLANVRAQAIMSAHLVKQAADVAEIPLTSSLKSKEAGSIFGVCNEQSLVALLPSNPSPDVVVSVTVADTKSMMGVNSTAVTRSDKRGFFEVVSLFSRERRGYRIDGFGLDPASGAILKVSGGETTSAPAVRPSARKRAKDWADRETDMRLNMFRCVSTTVFDLLDPLTFTQLPFATLFSGASNGELQYRVPFVGLPPKGTSYSSPCGVFFTKPGRYIKMLLAAGTSGVNGLLLNVQTSAEQAGAAVGEATRELADYTGVGYKAAKQENFIHLTAFRIASDMHALDDYRLRQLKKTGIFKKQIWDLHKRTAENLKQATEALKQRKYDRFCHNARLAWAVENRVYPDVRGTSNDVVRGVLFYFALLVPFVIFTERLLINYADIRKKLLTIALLFAISYLVLRFVHPAFRLSKTPIIILIGFFMCLAGSLVTVMLLQKFQLVMERIRQHVALVHRTDVARASAAMAAFILGISNMRKRKIRTALTAVTLILLTFTILSFTSFETQPVRMLRYVTSRKAPYNGVLMRSLVWSPLSKFVGDDLANFFENERIETTTRSWMVSRDKGEELRLRVQYLERGREAIANALLGLAPNEKLFTKVDMFVEEGGKWFDSSMEGWPFVCILPRRMAENLGIGPAEIGKVELSVLGRRLRPVARLESQRFFKECRDLDSEPLTPVDFLEEQMEQQPGAQEEEATPAFSATGKATLEDFIAQEAAEAEEKKGLYVHMDPDRVLIVPNELCERLGGTVRSVAASPSAAVERILGHLNQVLRKFTSRVDMALYAGVDGRIQRLATRSGTSVGGLKGLVVPIIIAALIVFNTMLGAVYERMTEIKIYASVGLAPMHIASLFLAESSVFAVVGAMVGYLLGQTVSFALMHMPWLMEGMSLNYSSMSAVWSAALVMFVVLASTAWPARMAGKLSVPDETRKMTIAAPTSDVWEIPFPFTVSTREALGVMSFLRGYFKSNDEDAIGAFTADNIELHAVKDGERQLVVLDSDVWVAPLDMGISQHVSMIAVPTPEEPEITELHFTIRRKSGEFQTWNRMNIGFLRDLRKQLLIWRLVTPEEKERFAEEGSAILAGQAPSQS